MTIASEIEDLNTNLTAAKNAVTAKGGTVGDTGLAGLATEIANIPSGSTEVESKYIDFYDYDGTRLYSWTEQELADATALPANPSHAGLTADGWNWTLAELRTQGTPMDVGQMYHTTDGKTHLFVEVDADHLTPNLAIGLQGTATIDWGDGSATTALTGTSISAGQNSYHTYTAAGSYEVTIDVAEGSYGALRGTSRYVSLLWKGEATQSAITVKNISYANQLKELWVGNNMQVGDESTTSNPFRYSGMEKIVLPNTLTDTTYMGNSNESPFVRCAHLKYVVIPKGITAQNKSSSYSPIGRTSIGACFPCGIKNIGYYTAWDASTRFAIPYTVTTVYRVVSSYGQIYIPEGVTSITGVIYTTNTGYGDTIKYPSSMISGAYIQVSDGAIRPFVMDFSASTAVPTMQNSYTSYLSYADGLVIKVPAALEAEWKAAQYWSDYAAYIVGV